MSAVFSYKQAAIQLGVNERTVSDLVRIMGLTPGQHPTNGSAKALTDRDVIAMRRRLGIDTPRSRSAPSTVPA